MTNYGYPNFYNQYDPSLSAQQRMAQMQQQYPQYMPPQPPQPQQQPQAVQQRGFIVIPVTSEDEAKASPVDTVNDTPSFFFNRGKNEIYLKQFNRPTGGANFETFTLVPSNLSGSNEQKKVNPYQESFNVINDKLDRLYSMFNKNADMSTNSTPTENEIVSKSNGLKKGAKNAE